jgi:alanyl-tRNA synthetase
MDDPDVLEIWNLVFMQYNREEDGSLRPLPNKHIDTGMGLERLISVIQDKRSNYDTDVFQPIFDKIREFSGVRAYEGRVGKDDSDGIDTAYRIIADHIRTLSIAISDGGFPSNEGRGYVLRRILRRAVRYSRDKMNARCGFFSSLVDVVVSSLGDAFPELKEQQATVKQVILEEEQQFFKTLDRGSDLFKKCADSDKTKAKNQIAGDDAWKLYDTYGFPLDLTKLMAEERGLGLDEEGFKNAQEEARERSRNNNAGGDVAIDNPFTVKLDVHQLKHLSGLISQTADESKYSTKTEKDIHKAKVLSILFNNDFVQDISKLKAQDNKEVNSYIGLILDSTNFYAESGGQEYDLGSIKGQGFQIDVENVQVFGGYILHIGTLQFGEIKVGDAVTTHVNMERRKSLMNNHTSTHLLNFALQKVLQKDLDQKGSLVASDRFRFDFNSLKGVTVPELEQIESTVSEIIGKDDNVYSQVVPLPVAKSISGLRAVFGEVYPDPVRVVSVGFDINEILKEPANPKWASTSIELCGGTHVSRTGAIKKFKITSEGTIAKGIRRIVAITGEKAVQSEKLADDLLRRVANLKTKPVVAIENDLKHLTLEVDKALISVVQKNQLRNELAALKKAFDNEAKAKAAQQAKEVQDKITALLAEKESSFYVIDLDVGDNDKVNVVLLCNSQVINKAVDVLFKSKKVGMVYSVSNEKIVYQCNVPDSIVDVKANEWVQSVEPALENAKSGGGNTKARGSATLKSKDEFEKLAKQFVSLRLK